MPDLPCLLFSDDIEPDSELQLHLHMQYYEEESDNESFMDTDDTSDTVYIRIHSCLPDYFSFINDADYHIATAYISHMRNSGYIMPIFYMLENSWFVPIFYLTSFVTFISQLGYQYDLFDDDCDCMPGYCECIDEEEEEKNLSMCSCSDC